MKNSNPDNMPMPGTEPNTVSQDGSIGGSDPVASHPDAQGAGDVRHTSYPRNEADENPAAGDTRTRSEELRDNPNARGGKTFHCSEVGPISCNWSVTGNSEEEMLPEIEKHGREVHGMTKLSQKIRSRIHDAIHDRAA